MQWFNSLAQASIEQPLQAPVSSNAVEYLQQVGADKLGWRVLRRKLYMTWSGQLKHECNRIAPEWTRALWIYEGIPQIGDALMDLAARSLLVEHGIAVDLATHSHLRELFNGDAWFGRVMTLDEVQASDQYDFIILMNHKQRALHTKRRLFPHLPWLSIHGYFTGPEFHRAEFVTQRLCEALNLTPSRTDWQRHAAQKLKPLVATCPISPSIGIAMGGVDSKRIYAHWVEIITRLRHLSPHIVLLGSGNGVAAAQALVQQFGNIDNRVNAYSLHESRTIIGCLDVMLCCDGGLMHLALTTTTPTLCLFNGLVKPEWRLPKSARVHAIQSATPEVSDIAPQSIVDKVWQLLP